MAVISSLANLEQESQVEPLDTVTTPNPDGTITVDFVEGVDDEDEGDATYLDFDGTSDEHYENLVEYLDEEQLTKLAEMVLENVDGDKAARDDWMKTIEFGFDLLGVKVEEGTTPFDGACSAQHPLLMESAVKFQSKASNELLPSSGPVHTKVLGDVSLEKENQANRVKNHMNFQITEEMTEFFPDTERMLLYVPLVGSGFKKTYYSSYLERPVSEFVPADLFIVPNSASDLYRAQRYTHTIFKTDYELEADFAEGFYTKPKDGIGAPSEPKLTDVQKKTHELIGIEVGIGDNSKVYTLYEQHLLTCIEGLDSHEGKKKDFKLASPYIITVDEGSRKVIGVRRNWKKEDKKRKKKVQFTHYQFVPSFNFYGFGYLHLLGNLQLSLTAALRTLVDAGQFATLQGGFKLKGTRIIDDGSPIHPGQFKELETVVQDINKAIMPLPFKEPSQTLYQMLEFLDRKGQKFADATEQVLADSSNYGPVGTTMALLDASTKFFSAIHKRLHNSLKQELKIIADINSETLPDDLQYNVENETMKVSRADYDARVDVVPISDPNISSNAHRMAKAQTILEISMRAPQLHDMREVLKHVYTNMDYANVDKILPLPEEAQQNDPMTDIQACSTGKPIKAFPGQDHKAHIAIKQAFLQDPMSGSNPMMQQVSIKLQANIQEHMLLGFMEQVQAQSQMSQGQQPQGEGADPMVQAAQQVSLMNQQKLQQEQEAAKKNDVDTQVKLMIAQAELQDTETQARSQQFNEIYKTADLELKKERLDMDKVKELNRAEEKRSEYTNKISEMVQTKGLDAMIAGLSAQIDKGNSKSGE